MEVKEFAEVRCDYLDEENGHWSVDAWMTDDDSEQGKTVAYINDLTAQVIYADPLARVSKLVKEVVGDKIRELDRDNKIRVRLVNGTPLTYMRTKHGDMVFEPDDNCNVDAMYVGMYVKGDFFDLVAAEALDKGVRFLSYNDPRKDCPQVDNVVDIHKFYGAVGEEGQE